jgi:hypothetical protein
MNANWFDAVSRRLGAFGTRCAALALLIVVGLLVLEAGPGVHAQEATPVTEPLFEGVELEVVTFGPVPAYPPEPAEIALLRLRFEPGGRLLVPADDPGMAIHYVEIGTLTFRFSTPVVVTRSTQEQEQVPAETEFTLEAGDAFTAPPPSGGEFRNDGTEEATLLIAVIGPVAAEATPEP